MKKNLILIIGLVLCGVFLGCSIVCLYIAKKTCYHPIDVVNKLRTNGYVIVHLDSDEELVKYAPTYTEHIITRPVPDSFWQEEFE